MHASANRMIRDMCGRPWSAGGPSCMVIGPYEDWVQNPLQCSVDVPGRSKSPAREMMDGLRIVRAAWSAVKEHGEYSMTHALGHVEIEERVRFDKRGREVVCTYSAQHFEIADLSLVAPALLQKLLATRMGLRCGYVHVNSATLTRHASLGAVDRSLPSEPSPPLNLVSDLDRWVIECNLFCDEGLVLGFTERFFRKVAGPLLRSLELADEDPAAALESARACEWRGWALAQVNWLEREPCAT